MKAIIGDWALCITPIHHPKYYTINKPYKIDKITKGSAGIQIFHTLDNTGKENGLSEVGFGRILNIEEKKLAEMLFK